MQISLETTEGLGRRLSIQVPAEEVDKKIDEQVSKVAKTAVIDGFRPGKVPLSFVKKRFGQKIRQDVVSEVIQDSLTKAVEQEDVRMAGYPAINIKVSEANKPLEYEATFEVFPAIDLVDLNDTTVDQYASEIKDEDLETMLDRLRKQYVEWNETDAPAKLEDKVEMDCEGKIDGVSFDEGNAKNMPVILGSKSLIPGFEDKLVGIKTGDHLEITLPFPEDYHHKDYAGKEATFSVTVNKVFSPVYPPLNDEFAKKMGVETEGLEGLRARLRKNMERELSNALHHINKTQVMDKLLEKNEVVLPKAMVDSEIDALRNQAAERYRNYAQTKKAPELPAEMFQQQAERRVTLGLLMGEIVKKHELKADPDKVRALIEEMASAYDQPEEIIQWYYSEPERISQYEMVVLEDEIVKKLLETAKVENKQISYDEVLKMNK